MDFKCPIITRYAQPESSKIPRPANAFMLYANHNRKKMAQLYPLESNKDISKRLGNSWKELDSVEKIRYYDLAKQVDAEHKRKYPDYVYNPKEARIRKAMREASRERALGVTPMPTPRGARRSSTWNFSEEEQLMMNSSHGMRGIIGPPMCSSPGFPIPTTGNGPFMQSMHYSKHMHPIPHTSSSYMQASPISQLPPQSEIWHPYEDSLRNTTPGPYMMQSQIQAYQPPPEITPPTILPQEKPKMEPEIFTNTDDTQSSHTNENVPPNANAGEKVQINQPVFENKVESIQPLIETGNMQPNEPFMPTYAQNVIPTHYEKSNDVKMKKDTYSSHASCSNEKQSRISAGNIPAGVTNPKQPCPEPGNYSNLFQNQDVNYHKEYIRNYLESSECDAMEILIDEDDISNGFSYVTYPYPHLNQYDFINSIDINDIYLLENFNSSCADCSQNSEALNLSTSRSSEDKYNDK